MKIKELNHNLLRIHTLELSVHAFKTRWLKEDRKLRFDSKMQILFDKIIESVTTPSLQKIRIFIEKTFVP
jgi:hypothetical protein